MKKISRYRANKQYSLPHPISWRFDRHPSFRHIQHWLTCHHILLTGRRQASSATVWH